MQTWLGIAYPFAIEIGALALVWYAASALARSRVWLVAAIAFALVAVLEPPNPFWVLACVAAMAALLASSISHFAGKIWAFPCYTVALSATLMVGVTGYNQGQFSEGAWMLLGLALLIYVIGVVERTLLLAWCAPFFAIWAVIMKTTLLGDLYWPFIVALLAAACGLGVRYLLILTPGRFNTARANSASQYALPLYVTALAAAVLTGIYGVIGGVNKPFFAAVPTALLCYALVAYGIILVEKWNRWLILVASLALGGTLLTLQTTTCLGIGFIPGTVTDSCSVQVAMTLYSLTTLVVVTGVLGILVGRFIKGAPAHAASATTQWWTRFAWSWPWYVTAFAGMLITAGWCYRFDTLLPHSIVLSILCLFVVLAIVIMLLERTPELLFVPVGLMIWTIAQTEWPSWQQLLVDSLLFVLVFATQFMWRFLLPETRMQRTFSIHRLLSLFGQVLVILITIGLGGLVNNGDALVHVGALSLLILAGLIFWSGLLVNDKTVQRGCGYSAGLLFSFAISWELLAFQQTRIDVLLLAPATYLVVIASFLGRDEQIPGHYKLGQLCAMLGSALLLFPALWFSFSESNLLPTLILGGEAVALLLLGIGTRVRIFVLCGTALVIIGALRALFLPSLGLPPSLALTVLGVTLLALATILSVMRQRILAAWKHMD